MVERWTIPARKRDGGGVRAFARGLAQGGMRCLRASAQEAPRFCLWPTDGRKPPVRPGLTCAIFNPAPRAANRGRRPLPEALPRPLPARALATDERRKRRFTCAVAGGERCGTRKPTETRYCCSGCSGGCCCGWRSARCSGCCSRTRRAQHASALREPRRPKPASPFYHKTLHIQENCARGAARPFAAHAATSEQHIKRWGTRKPTETRHCRPGCPGGRRSGRRSARSPGCCSRTRRAQHATFPLIPQSS